MTYQDVFPSSRDRRIFKIEANKVLGETSICDLVHLVQNEVQQVKPGYQCRW
jgi:hypothetical protein